MHSDDDCIDDDDDDDDDDGDDDITTGAHTTTTIGSTGDAYRKKRRERGMPQLQSTPITLREKSDTNGNYSEHGGAANTYRNESVEPTKIEVTYDMDICIVLI